MNKISREIFKAIHEGKWLAVEYKNKDNKTTNYWIGIKDIDCVKQMLIADGLNVSSFQITELKLFYSSIINATIIDGSYFPINREMLNNIESRPSRYTFIFKNVTNLKLLDYYSECNRLDSTPYRKDYALIDELDLDAIGKGNYHLTDNQFRLIVKDFNKNTKRKDKRPQIDSLCVNVLSVNTKRGLYVLAYKKLFLDVTHKILRQDDEVSISSEFTLEGTKYSISYFLDADEIKLLDDFTANAETIKDCITNSHPEYSGVDDRPYVLALSRDYTINLDEEYSAIMDMYGEDTVTYPIKAFFGDVKEKPRRFKEYPIALYNDKVNLDQLLAIHNGLKYPVLYVQGPPGSGKTNTILNTVIAAFFNNKSVLITSYNNHPIDEIFNKLSNLEYKDNIIPFPVIRLGNNDKIKEAIQQIKKLYERTNKVSVFESSLDKKKSDEEIKTEKLSSLLHNYEERLDLLDRKEMIETMMSSSNNLALLTDLQGTQLYEVEKKLEKTDSISEETILNLVRRDRFEFLKYLFYTSAKYIKKLAEPRYKELIDILYCDDADKAVEMFNKYISNDSNFQKFVKVFPIVVTTNISAHKLGKPKQYFDMVIMDEASQCNTAIALVPVLRGKQMILVGDPQQLKPVILLDEKTNSALKKRYNVSDEYDYRNKSVYQTFLATDAVSDEILLSYHYRCHPKIINFNNKKYYNNKLKIKSEDNSSSPLVFVNCKCEDLSDKNSSLVEAKEIVHYIKTHNDKSIGVVTPFVNQKNLIQELLKKNNIVNVNCGTVHAFQGDEKQEIIFSSAITKQTGEKTYEWLKNNRELINVATSRAKEKLIIIGDLEQINRLNKSNEEDDFFDLIKYVQSNGKTSVSQRETESRALGIKPYSTETETAFLETLNHAINAMAITKSKYTVKKEVPISQVFKTTSDYNDLFYTGRFDYVVFEKNRKQEYPVFAIELDGNEHVNDPVVIERDQKKQEICNNHNFQLVRVPNNYARRYYYVKEILNSFFGNV